MTYKIPDLDSASTPDGSELVEIVQRSVNKKITLTALRPPLTTYAHGAPVESTDLVAIERAGVAKYVTAAELGYGSAGGPAGGDLTGTYPNPTLDEIIAAATTDGSGTTVPVITFDAKGRITNVTRVDIVATVSAASLVDAAADLDAGQQAAVRGSLAAASQADLSAHTGAANPHSGSQPLAANLTTLAAATISSQGLSVLANDGAMSVSGDVAILGKALRKAYRFVGVGTTDSVEATDQVILSQGSGTGSSPTTLNLPTLSAAGTGRVLHIINDSVTDVLNVVPSGTEQINLVNAPLRLQQGQSVTLIALSIYGWKVL